jgi:hypothetical protein
LDIPQADRLMDSPSIRERSYCLDLDKSARFANNDSDGGAAVCMHQIGAVCIPGCTTMAAAAA